MSALDRALAAAFGLAGQRVTADLAEQSLVRVREMVEGLDPLDPETGVVLAALLERVRCGIRTVEARGGLS